MSNVRRVAVFQLVVATASYIIVHVNYELRRMIRHGPDLPQDKGHRRRRRTWASRSPQRRHPMAVPQQSSMRRRPMAVISPSRHPMAFHHHHHRAVSHDHHVSEASYRCTVRRGRDAELCQPGEPPGRMASRNAHAIAPMVTNVPSIGTVR